MNHFISYAVESISFTGVMYLIYVLILRNRPLLTFNRYLILAILFIGALLPLINIPVTTSTPIPTGTTLVQGMLAGVEVKADTFLSFSDWKLYYFLVSLTLLILLISQVIQLLQVKKQSERFSNADDNIRWFNGKYPHFSFFKTIYLNKDFQQDKDEIEYIIAHEKVHAQQWHSLDILLLESMKVIMWYNPFVWLLKPCMVENHEYLADKFALKNEPQKSFEYLNQLIGSALFSYKISLVNNFNHSLIKKRIIMMTKRKINRIERMIPLVLIPAIIGIALFFSCSDESTAPMDDLQDERPLVKVVNEEGDTFLIAKTKDFTPPEGIVVIEDFVKEDDTNTKTITDDEQVFYIVEEMPKFEGKEPDAFRKFVMENVIYPEEAKQNGVEGKVFVQFVVSSGGKVTQAKVVRGVDPNLDAEALRVVNSSPDWQPGVQRGKKVAVQFIFPITFSLK